MPHDKLEKALAHRAMAKDAKGWLETMTDALRESHETPMEPPPPTMFQPDPPVVGGPEFARIAQKFLSLDPTTKKNVSKIVSGPTDGSMIIMGQSKLPIDMFGNTTLKGAYSLRDKSIGINPTEVGEKQAATLIHELMHAAGADEGRAQDIDKKLGINMDVMPVKSGRR